MRLVRFVIGCCAATAALAGCSSRGPSGPTAAPSGVAPSATPVPTALPSVAAAPQAKLPPWIVSISPRGEAKDGSQIRVRFASDVVPVEALESPDRQSALAHFSIEPNLPGHFIFLTPRMVGFEADAPIPHAARIRVTAQSGLADLAGHTLGADVVWSFTTQPLVLSNLPNPDPSQSPTPQSRTPRFGIDASDAVDVASLVAHAKLIDASDPAKSIAVAIAPSPSPDPSASAGAAGDASGADAGSTTTHYDLVPAEQLAYDRTYRLLVGSGVMPAAGNIGTASDYVGRIRTYGALAFTGVTYGSSGRFESTAPSLGFSNPIDATTALKAISISPSPIPGVPLLTADDSGTVAIDPDALEPDTAYVATIATTLTDSFGQTLGAPATAHFQTGDLAPSLFAPVNSRIFPTGTNLGIDVQSVNLPDGSFRGGFRPVRPEDLIARDLDQLDDVSALGPDESRWIVHPLAQKKNVEIDTVLPLQSMMGAKTGTIAYAYSARTTRSTDQNGKVVWDTPEFHGAVQITNLGVFTQWFPGGGFVRVRHLGDGSVVPNARVDVYESTATLSPKPATTNATPCASGRTGADGTWRPDATAWAACASLAASADQAPALLAIVHDGSDWSYARSAAYENGYDVGLGEEGWSAGTPHARGALISDRTLYQPGETAKFVGVSYFERNGTIGRGRSTSFALVATSPSGAKTDLGSATPDAYGAFPVTFALPKSAAVGDWQIGGTGRDGETLAGSFTVAEFKPPNFKVELALAETPVPAGTAVPASSKSTYLFGAPVQGGTSHVAVTRARTSYAPDGFDAYAFGRQWTYPESEPDVTSDVLQADLTVDANGDAAMSVPVAADLPFPMQYTVTTQTTDVSNLAVADTKSFVALPSDVSIGLRTAFVAETGKAFDVDAIALGIDGKLRAGRALKLVLQQRVDASATQVVEGGESARPAVRYVDVATQDVTSGDAAVKVSFTADKPGDYRVRANFADATSDATATDATLWITGPGEASWIAGENATLGVKLDKSTYRPGDTVHVLVQSPYADAEMFVAVVRHGVLYQRTTVVHGVAPEATFTVTKDMLPNAVVQAVLVRRGAPLASGVPHGLDTLSRVGFAPFEVALDAKYLRVDVHPATATVLPGARERVSFRLRGKDGSAARGEFAVAVVNDAILQLSGYRFPDLVKSVYADEPISTRLADNYGDVKLQSERQPLDKGFGFGGGAMAGPAGTRIRTKFLPLAYFNAAVHTDANGNATVDVPLPDDLTTWRVMALALTSDARFGNGEATFVATKPLVTDPILPQFARPGDRFAAGVSITNVAHGTGDVAVKADLSGGASFASGAPHTESTSAPGGAATQAVRFDVVAGGPADASFTLRTTLGANADAFTFGVPILSDDVTESAITTGTTDATASVPLTVSSALHGPLGGLDVTVASTLLAEALEPTKTLAEPHVDFATELGSRIAVAADAIVLDRTYGRAAAIPALRKSAETDLTLLRSLALPDGGFAEWPGAKRSEVFTTSFVIQQLLQARGAGLDVGSDLTHALGFERKALANPSDIEDVSKTETDEIAEVRLEALETLGAAGDARSDFLGDIVKSNDRFAYYERVELARFLLRLPDWRGRGIALRDTLFQQVNLGARHATVDTRGGFGESETAGQAQMLQLALASGTPHEDVDRLLESLLALRHDGRWGCSCDDAEAMNGLVLYAAQNARPPDFTVTAMLPAQPAQTRAHAFRGYATTTATDTVPMDALARGAGHVVLRKDGRGTLHYAVALRYRVPDASPGAYAGLRIDRIVRSVGDSSTVATFGLAAPTGAATVAAARVYDVEDRVVVDHPVENVLVTDPLPAGFEAVDQSFRTSAPALGESDDALALDYQSIYKNRVISFVAHLDPGSYAIHYLVRSVTPGTFAWPGAVAALQYEPEQFGRTAAAQLVITP